jgi:hypothetical protein
MASGGSTLELDQIQGNIPAGFNEDFATLLLLELLDRAPAGEWVDASREASHPPGAGGQQ